VKAGCQASASAAVSSPRPLGHRAEADFAPRRYCLARARTGQPRADHDRVLVGGPLGGDLGRRPGRPGAGRHPVAGDRSPGFGRVSRNRWPASAAFGGGGVGGGGAGFRVETYRIGIVAVRAGPSTSHGPRSARQGRPPGSGRRTATQSGGPDEMAWGLRAGRGQRTGQPLARMSRLCLAGPRAKGGSSGGSKGSGCAGARSRRSWPVSVSGRKAACRAGRGDGRRRPFRIDRRVLADLVQRSRERPMRSSFPVQPADACAQLVQAGDVDHASASGGGDTQPNTQLEVGAARDHPTRAGRTSASRRRFGACSGGGVRRKIPHRPSLLSAAGLSAGGLPRGRPARPR